MDIKRTADNTAYDDQLSADRLEEMRSVDPQTVDKDTLVDIADISIDTSLPKEERIRQFLKRVKNPYCYKDHRTVIKISFTGGRSMEDVLKDCVVSEAQSLPEALEPME